MTIRRRAPRPLKKWTKKAIRAMTSEIDGFVLTWELYHPLETIRALVQAHRPKIVRNGLRGAAKMHRDRAKRHRATSSHWAKMGPIWGQDTSDIVIRFAAFALEEEKKAAEIVRILVTIRELGLPPEVLEHRPVRF